MTIKSKSFKTGSGREQLHWRCSTLSAAHCHQPRRSSAITATRGEARTKASRRARRNVPTYKPIYVIQHRLHKATAAVLSTHNISYTHIILSLSLLLTHSSCYYEFYFYFCSWRHMSAATRHDTRFAKWQKFMLVNNNKCCNILFFTSEGIQNLQWQFAQHKCRRFSRSISPPTLPPPSQHSKLHLNNAIKPLLWGSGPKCIINMDKCHEVGPLGGPSAYFSHLFSMVISADHQ